MTTEERLAAAQRELERARAELATKTQEWEGERKFIEQIESWLGADCHGSLGTGIKAAIDRRGQEIDQAREEIARLQVEAVRLKSHLLDAVMFTHLRAIAQVLSLPDATPERVVAAVRERRWIPVAESDPPKDGTRIFVLNDRGGFAVEWHDVDGFDWWFCQDGKYDDRPLRGSAPTHWMAIPAPGGLNV